MAEAIIIHDYLVRTNSWDKIKEKSRSQIEILKNSNPTSWFRMNIGCPILEDELCKAYPVRPPECSTHFVKSNPELCHPWSAQSGKYEKFDMVDLFDKFSEFVKTKTDNYGIFRINLPIPLALLLAERIQKQSNKDTFETMRMMFNELNY
jgi:Fe-S-cluster containining protein